MRERAPVAVLAAVLAAAIALGAAWFPRAEDPGRADAGGYRLNLRLTPYGATANDWYDAGVVSWRTTGDRLRFAVGNGPLQVFTRPLAVYADRCYVATTRVRRVGAGSLSFAVMDEDVRRVLHARNLQEGGWRTVRLVFSTGGRRRIALAFVGWPVQGPAAALTVADAALLPTAAGACGR